MNMKKMIVLAAMLISLTAMAQTPVITFNETTHDFGKINEADGRVTTIFQFKNDGMIPLVLSNVRASCGCNTPKWTHDPIAPGATGEITVTYNPSGRPGRFQKTITITSNATQPTTPGNTTVLEGNRENVVIDINKIDTSNQEDVLQLAAWWKERVPKAEIFLASALEKFNLNPIFERIVELLPVNEAWYDKDTLTDRNLRFFASEIIREKILLNYNKEIPYCTEVVIEEFKELPDRYDIRAVINVMRDSQKGIIIGAKGSSLKRVGMQSREDMEEFFEKKVFLQMYVKVNPDWREDKRKLKAFGYIN
jgi:hypothetical protein